MQVTACGVQSWRSVITPESKENILAAELIILAAQAVPSVLFCPFLLGFPCEKGTKYKQIHALGG